MSNALMLYFTQIGLDAGPQPGGPNQFAYNAGNAGILASGWGSGTANVGDCLLYLSWSILTTVNTVYVPDFCKYLP